MNITNRIKKGPGPPRRKPSMSSPPRIPNLGKIGRSKPKVDCTFFKAGKVNLLKKLGEVEVPVASAPIPTPLDIGARPLVKSFLQAEEVAIFKEKVSYKINKRVSSASSRSVSGSFGSGTFRNRTFKGICLVHNGVVHLCGTKKKGSKMAVGGTTRKRNSSISSVFSLGSKASAIGKDDIIKTAFDISQLFCAKLVHGNKIGLYFYSESCEAYKEQNGGWNKLPDLDEVLISADTGETAKLWLDRLKEHVQYACCYVTEVSDQFADNLANKRIPLHTDKGQAQMRLNNERLRLAVDLAAIGYGEKTLEVKSRCQKLVNSLIANGDANEEASFWKDHLQTCGELSQKNKSTVLDELRRKGLL